MFKKTLINNNSCMSLDSKWGALSYNVVVNFLFPIKHLYKTNNTITIKHSANDKFLTNRQKKQKLSTKGTWR